MYKECDGVQGMSYDSCDAKNPDEESWTPVLPGEDGREAQHLTPVVKIVK